MMVNVSILILARPKNKTKWDFFAIPPTGLLPALTVSPSYQYSFFYLLADRRLRGGEDQVRVIVYYKIMFPSQPPHAAHNIVI